MRAARKLLIALPQLPFDPASGAARTATTVGELLADAGFEVTVIATTVSEADKAIDVPRLLSELDVDAARQRGPDGDVIRFARRRVLHTLLDTGKSAMGDWESAHGARYDRLFDNVIARVRPDLLITYGGSTRDQGRQKRARASGVRVVFALYNASYSSSAFFVNADRVITPSAFLSNHYRRLIGLTSDTLPTALWPDDVLARSHSPRVVTMVNPSLDKGLMFFASLADLLGRQRPDIPVEVYTSRCSPSFLMQAAALGGIDLSIHPALAVLDMESSPATMFAHARLLIVPSLVEDAAPRVVAEALVNGVPPLGSDRGGIPEMCADAGYVLRIPRTVDPSGLRPPPTSAVQPWIKTIIRLFDEAVLWRDASARARRAGARYLPANVTSSYVDYFDRVLAT